MPRTTFDALPAGSKIWVLAADRPLAGDEDERIRAMAEKVMGAWDKKQPGLGGCWELRDGRFLIFGADQTREPLDGCTVDAMMHWVLRFEQEAGLRLVDRMTVFYRDAEGVVQSAGRSAFRKLHEQGALTDATPVFDTTLLFVEGLREGRFELPLAESWHAQLCA
jgi:hypothetical protein